MHPKHVAASAMLAIAGWALGVHAEAAAQVRMQTVEIVDPNGFEQPMVAATIEIPAGWRHSGGIRWQPQAACGADATQLHFTAQDQTGLFAVEIMPVAAWQATNLPVPQHSGGCPFLNITSPQQYLGHVVQRIRPGAAILDYRPRPDLIATPPMQIPGAAGVEQRRITEGGEALIGYQIGAQAIREVLQVVTDVFVTRMPGVYPGEIREFLTGTTWGVFAMRAPDGALSFAAADAIRSSLKLNAAWQAKMQGHQSAITSANAKGARDRSEIVARTGREVNDMINKGWQERQAAQDRMHERTIRGIRGTELFATPQGGNVELPGILNRAWQTPAGNYITTDDSTFDPNRNLGIGATEMQRID